MKTVEFDAQVQPDGTIRIPAEAVKELRTNSQVHVVLTSTDRSPEVVREGIEATFGAWKDDPSVPEIFEQIERERKADFGRDVEMP